jgi:hypothetical protein
MWFENRPLYSQHRAIGTSTSTSTTNSELGLGLKWSEREREGYTSHCQVRIGRQVIAETTSSVGGLLDIKTHHKPRRIHLADVIDGILAFDMHAAAMWQIG